MEQFSLADLRKSCGLSQVELAYKMGVEQSQISRLERQQDMRTSSLRKYIEACGGELSLLVKMPDGKSYRLKLGK